MVHITVNSDAKPAQKGLKKFWQESVGSGHARLGLRDDWRKQLRQLHNDTGVHGVRFHGSFDDDMGPVVSLAPNGSAVYNFTLLDQLYDGILAAGVRFSFSLRLKLLHKNVQSRYTLISGPRLSSSSTAFKPSLYFSITAYSFCYTRMET